MQPPRSDSDGYSAMAARHGFCGRVLLAEDDHHLRQLLVASLSASGHFVQAVPDGHGLMHELAGLMLENQPRFDVVVTDVRMPGWSGLAALNGLRCAGCLVPVILLTAFPTPDLQLLARELKAQVLSKPFELEELTLAVASTLPYARPFDIAP